MTTILESLLLNRRAVVLTLVGSLLAVGLGLGVASAVAPIGGDAALEVKDTIARFMPRRRSVSASSGAADATPEPTSIARGFKEKHRPCA